MKQYHDMLNHIIQNGRYKSDRTGTGTISVFGYQMRLPLRNASFGFPLLTTKKLFTKGIIHELLWFLRGDTSIKYLKDNGVSIWDEWVLPGTEVWGQLLTMHQRLSLVERRGFLERYRAFRNNLDDKDDWNLISDWLDAQGIPQYELLDGQLGPVYGSQWRRWPGRLFTLGDFEEAPANSERIVEDQDGAFVHYRESIDQIKNVVETLRSNPHSRRVIVSAWNPAEVDNMALPPCHCLFQFYSEALTKQERIELFCAGDSAEAIMQDPKWPGFEAMPDEDIELLFDIHRVPKRQLSCQLYQRSAERLH